MNDKIKFRVWDLLHKQWVNNCVIQDDGTIFNTNSMMPESNCVVQFWTGFKDKNGKEIYEGDFLSVEDEIFLIVEWSKELGRFQERNPESGEKYEILSVYKDEYVVIGNIFKAPCNPDHNAECLVCDCWLSECPFRK
jgi:hypothetical protein